jgi:hypothetical protein
MRYLVMHKLNARLERGQMPTPEEIAEIHGTMGEAGAAGILLGGDGLLPSRERFLITYRAGERTVTPGPFSLEGPATELLGRILSITVRSRDEALAWLDRIAAILGDSELFLGPCTEAWHLGLAPEPENPPLRLLAMYRADDRAEADLPPDPQQAAKLSALFDEMRAAGVLTNTTELASSKHGARIQMRNGEPSVSEGPLAGSTLLLSGYAIFELPSKAEAINWGIRWARTVKVEEVDVRPLAG